MLWIVNLPWSEALLTSNIYLDRSEFWKNLCLTLLTTILKWIFNLICFQWYVQYFSYHSSEAIGHPLHSLNPWTAGNTWVHSQHCGYWYPGAKAPGHQYPQCWLNVDCIIPVLYKNITPSNKIAFWTKLSRYLRVKGCPRRLFHSLHTWLTCKLCDGGHEEDDIRREAVGAALVGLGKDPAAVEVLEIGQTLVNSGKVWQVAEKKMNKNLMNDNEWRKYLVVKIRCGMC